MTPVKNRRRWVRSIRPDLSVLEDIPTVLPMREEEAVVEVEKLPTEKLSIGAEVYYSVLNKFSGMSTAL
ncbi:hypothetical protein EV426DRAFT_708787 [Tirmania nivea]|nr:hypothetical protein EV426DRAFT_708787 [Tirmania nivea]